jgi:hypothetical protein
LEKWESFLQILIQPQVLEIHKERAREIKEVLEKLSEYPYDPVRKFRNIQTNDDFPRDELRGAVQRYIYGNFVDSILYSCFATEFALLVKLDEKLSELEKRSVPKPFMLAKIIDWASPSSRKNPYGKGILDKETKRVAKRILELRNMHIHASNFISGAILSYKSNIGLAKQAGLTPDMIEKSLEFVKILPKDVQALLVPYSPADVKKAFETIPALSSFEWCSNKRLLRSTKREIDSLVGNFLSAVLEGDSERLGKYLQEDYLLKQRALRALKDSCLILENIGIL